MYDTNISELAKVCREKNHSKQLLQTHIVEVCQSLELPYKDISRIL